MKLTFSTHRGGAGPERQASRPPPHPVLSHVRRSFFWVGRGVGSTSGRKTAVLLALALACGAVIPSPWISPSRRFPVATRRRVSTLLRWEDFPKSADPTCPPAPVSLLLPSVFWLRSVRKSAGVAADCCFDAGFDRFVCCCIHLLCIRELTGRKMKICLRFSARLFGGRSGRTPPVLHIHIFPYPKSRWVPAPNDNHQMRNGSREGADNARKVAIAPRDSPAPSPVLLLLQRELVIKK